MTMLMWWALFFGFCLILELSSPGYFFFLSFSSGSLFAALGSWYEVSLLLQVLIFLGVSAFAFFLLRSYVAHNEEKDGIKTNMDALHGKKGLVIEDISSLSKGWIKVDGQMWAALPYDQIPIEKGSVVKVVGSAGSHLIVRK